MTMENCYARSYCTMFGNESQCNYGCVAYHQMNTIFDLSRIPKKYRHSLPLVPDNVDLPKFLQLKQWIDVEKQTDEEGKTTFQHKVLDKVSKGDGLFLWSEVKGNGKTSWAMKIMQAYFRAVGVTNNLRTRGLYINVPEFLEDMRRNMDNPTSEHSNLVKLLKTVDLVVFDDIGTEAPTNWVREQLYILINHRDSECLSSIFTSNLSLSQLAHPDVLGERIASRISGCCDIVQLEGEDKRYSSRNGGTA